MANGPGLRNNVARAGAGDAKRFMDKLDRKILDLLQNNGTLTAAEIADRVGLSKAPCWRRIKKLQEDGVIKQTVALLDARSLNVGTTVFVTLKTANHRDRKSTRLNSSHLVISYAVFCLKKKKRSLRPEASRHSLSSD